jgi:hypothetical protein
LTLTDNGAIDVRRTGTFELDMGFDIEMVTMGLP